MFAEERKHVETAHAGHYQIEDAQLKGLRLEQSQCFVTGDGLQNFITRAAQNDARIETNGIVVIDQQDSGHVQRW